MKDAKVRVQIWRGEELTDLWAKVARKRGKRI